MNRRHYADPNARLAQNHALDLAADILMDDGKDLPASRSNTFFYRWLDDWKLRNKEVRQ